MNERVTFAAQDSLPQLPVPDLSGTLQRYVKSVESLLTAEEFEKTKALAADFERTDGPMLQKLLEQQAEEASKRKGPTVVLDENHPDGSAYPNSHWLEGWWEKYAYLSDRVPLLVNVNCFQSHFRATTCPKPLTRAAWSIKGGLDSVRLLQQELVPPDRAGKAVFCSAQYHRVYNTTRIPGEAIDEIHTYSSSKHIAVQRRGHWYVIHDALGMSPSEIERQLTFIKEDAAGREAGPYVATFTGVERTSWAKARQGLLRLDPTNIETLWWIESAIFHVSLSEESPTTPNEVQELGMCGRNDIWFDKNGTHVVFENGAMITNLEHASADAVVPARLYCYMDEFVQQNAPELGITEGQGAKALLAGVSGIPVTKYQEGDESTNEQRARPGRLDFVLDGALKQALSKAQGEVKALLKDNAVECLDFQDFGGKTISKTCKGVSTDSFVQMSLALAYYRDQGEMPVTYETATTRSFFHGRTETIRPQSLAMREFVQGFDTGKISEGKLADLIREAANAHRNYLRSCMGGQGVDRHLMGLRILAAERGMPLHPLFEDKAYVKSTSHTLSTSQMPIALSDWPGFGAYSSNAYGTCYRFTFEDTIVATVSSRKVNSGNKDAKRFSEAIKQAFRDVKRVLEANPPAPKAKL